MFDTATFLLKAFQIFIISFVLLLFFASTVFSSLFFGCHHPDLEVHDASSELVSLTAQPGLVSLGLLALQSKLRNDLFQQVLFFGDKGLVVADSFLE